MLFSAVEGERGFPSTIRLCAISCCPGFRWMVTGCICLATFCASISERQQDIRESERDGQEQSCISHSKLF